MSAFGFNISINRSRTFGRRHRKRWQLSFELRFHQGITHYSNALIVVGCDLSARLHISDTLGACSRSVYALRVLKAHGLPPAALQEVARATALARLLYASPAWWGFAKKEDRNQLESLVKRMRRMGYLPSSTSDVEDLVHAAEDRLLGAVVVNSNHVLHPLFPPILVRRPGLRPRPHGFILPLKDDYNFIHRVLYRSLQPPSTNNI